MGFFDSFINGLGSAVGTGVGEFGLGSLSTAMDSWGASQHGRDQYFARDMQREFLERQIQAQMDALHENQQFSREMLDLQWQKTLEKYPELAKMQSDAQFNLWKNQFDEANRYNSPLNQVKRMGSAGLAPQSLAGGAGAGGSSSMGASGSVAPPVLSGSPLGGSVSPIGLPQGMSTNGSTLASIGSFIRDLAQARLMGSQKTAQDLENTINEKVIDDKVKAVGLKNKYTEEQISLMQQQFAEITGRMNVMRKDVELTDKQIKWFDSEMSAKIGELQASKEYHEALSKYTDKERELLEACFDDLKNYQMYSTQSIQRLYA